MSNNARFVSWLRAALPPANAFAVSAAGHNVSVPVSRYAPGDVIGVSATLIKTRQPAPDSIGMPPNLFPYIEFSQPDLPWCVTPGDPDAHGQLTPWLALIVVEAPSADPLGQAGGGKLPVIEVQGSALPPWAELAQWAHVQIASDGAQSDDLMRQGTARILSPRALSPSTRYIACLVPVFEAGRLAGLGQTVPDRTSTALAWSDTTGSLQLPVYDHWFFSTAPSGDFETLARRLRGRDISSGSKPLALNVSAVSGDVDGNSAPLEGALRPVGSGAQWTGPAVAASSKLLSSWMVREAAAGPPVVGPPIYGSIQSGKTQITTGWVADLNLDARRRAAAGLGAELVRANQDELVDEAWRQVGDLPRARREHAGALLADAATAGLHTRLIAPLGGAHALLILAPAATVMKDAAASTVAARIVASTLPSAVLSAPFRRMLAVKTTPEARRAGHGIARTLPIENARAIVPGAQPPTPARLVTDLQIRKSVLPAAGDHPVATTSTTGATTSTTRTAAGAPRDLNVDLISKTLNANELKILTDAAPQLDARQPAVVEVAAPQPFAWIAPVQPTVTASVRLNIRVNLGDAARVRSNWTMVTAPRFQQPLAEWLDPAYLMAGVQIPPDTAGLLEVNGQFVEAVIAGANHELARELLWRGVPLDRSATLLGYFFESRSSAPPKECPAISTWKDADALGSHVTSGEKAVLVLRSRIVGHMSEALFYLAQAQMQGAYRVPGPNQLLPVFRGDAGVDTAYLGFEIAPEQIAGSSTDLGWYFVIQEREGAPRFGFDEVPSGPFTTWNDAAWAQITVTPGGEYVEIGKTTIKPPNPGTLAWGGGAAHMAGICLQAPVRVSIHGSLLVPVSPPKS